MQSAIVGFAPVTNSFEPIIWSTTRVVAASRVLPVSAASGDCLMRPAKNGLVFWKMVPTLFSTPEYRPHCPDELKDTVIAAVKDVEPGDVIITNDPYLSGGLSTHLPDLHLLQPYFHEGKVVCYGWCFIHSADVGGRVPSSISPSNYEIYQEGLMIPPVKLVKVGKFNPDVVAFIERNSRTGEENMGDLKAMVASLAVGERRVASMIAQHGAAAFDGARVNPPVEALAAAKTVLLAVKPQIWREAVKDVVPHLAPDAIIVSIAATLLALAVRARPALTVPVARWGSVGVILAGAYWFVDRLFGSGGP